MSRALDRSSNRISNRKQSVLRTAHVNVRTLGTSARISPAGGGVGGAPAVLAKSAASVRRESPAIDFVVAFRKRTSAAQVYCDSGRVDRFFHAICARWHAAATA